jgi:hypothetical protein
MLFPKNPHYGTSELTSIREGFFKVSLQLFHVNRREFLCRVTQKLTKNMRNKLEKLFDINSGTRKRAKRTRLAFFCLLTLLQCEEGEKRWKMHFPINNKASINAIYLMEDCKLRISWNHKKRNSKLWKYRFLQDPVKNASHYANF